MQRRFDLLIVGAGMFGATCAYELAGKGYRCLVIEKRDHIGGNCHTENRDGINVHKYGPHIFHTSNRKIWDWINQFATFNNYRHRPKVHYEGKAYSFPINLTTLQQLWGVKTAAEAQARLDEVRVLTATNDSVEDWLLSKVGREIYEIFFRGYTQKQWGRSPADLPASIVKRLPVRLTPDDNYFDDEFQGIPIGGYTAIFSKLLAGSETWLSADYFDDRPYFHSLAGRVLYTGPIDRFFDYCYGALEYRSTHFEFEKIHRQDFQGNSTIHHTAASVPFTRTVEHKHFEFGTQPVTWITREYPLPHATGQEPMYPIEDTGNRELLRRYKDLSELPEWRRCHFGGRLAEYRYYDMHQVIGSAMAMVKTIERCLIADRTRRTIAPLKLGTAHY